MLISVFSCVWKKRLSNVAWTLWKKPKKAKTTVITILDVNWRREMFCCSFTSHHDIITQPHLHSCCTINFNDHISSYLFQTILHLVHFLQTIVHFIHFLQTIVHLIHFYLLKSIVFRFNIFDHTHYIVIQPYCHFHLSTNRFSGN